MELFPLNLVYCLKCSLPQLSITVDPQTLYADYPYVTSRSQMMDDHLSKLFRDIRYERTGSVIEIGCNDGYVLKKLLAFGFGPVMGIDPAKNLCEIAHREGFDVVNGAFGTDSFMEARQFIEPADIVLARHVFCHIDDWHGFLEQLKLITHEESIVVIEVPNFAHTLMEGAFDQIYHEHLSYLTLDGLLAALKFSGWHQHDVYAYDIHGGSIAVILRRDESVIPKRLLPLVTNYDCPPDESLYPPFALRCRQNIALMNELCHGLVQKGKIVCGFGASAKSTVWINAAKLQDKVHYIFDNTHQKIGRYSPGTAIQIVAEEGLLECQPDYCILFAWNFQSEIIKRYEQYLERGGVFIIPIPEVKLFRHSDLKGMVAA